VPPFARPIPSFYPSVHDKSQQSKTMKDRPVVTMGSRQEVTRGQLKGPISNPHDHPFSKLGADNP